MTNETSQCHMYGFYPPNYGLDDYKLYYQLGQAAADKMEKKGFLDDVADGYEDLRVVIMDSPAVEAIHARDEGILDGLRTKYPDIPDEKVLWLDCGGGLGDECAEKVAPCIQANLADTNKWIFASGSGDSIHSTLALIKENGISMEDVMFIEAVAEDSVSLVLREDETESCVFLGLCTAPSGTGIGNMIIDLFKNGTPFPGLTSYEFIEVDHNNIDDFYKNYLEGNL